MAHAPAMSCRIDSPWGELWFEALGEANGYRIQLTRDGTVLTADWVANGTDLLARWQVVRSRLAIVLAQDAQRTARASVAGGPWWGDASHVPASVAAALRA